MLKVKMKGHIKKEILSFFIKKQFEFISCEKHLYLSKVIV